MTAERKMKNSAGSSHKTQGGHGSTRRPMRPNHRQSAHRQCPHAAERSLRNRERSLSATRHLTCVTQGVPTGPCHISPSETGHGSKGSPAVNGNYRCGGDPMMGYAVRTNPTSARRKPLTADTRIPSPADGSLGALSRCCSPVGEGIPQRRRDRERILGPESFRERVGRSQSVFPMTVILSTTVMPAWTAILQGEQLSIESAII